MIRYRTKSCTIKAICFTNSTGDSLKEIIEFMNCEIISSSDDKLELILNNDLRTINKGDYIIKNEEGAFDIVPKNLFEKIFEMY